MENEKKSNVKESNENEMDFEFSIKGKAGKDTTEVTVTGRGEDLIHGIANALMDHRSVTQLVQAATELAAMAVLMKSVTGKSDDEAV